MTLSNLMTLASPPIPQADLTYTADRTIWTGGGWKAGKGNPNSALSALTLLAFLFFLNILQNCLKDTIGQNPATMVMMIPTNVTARSKRETSRGNNHTDSLFNWSDTQINNLVHNHVASYWSEKNNNAKSSKTLKNYKYTSKQQTQLESEINQYRIKGHIENNHKISTKLDSIHKNKIRTKIHHNKFDMYDPNNIVGFNKTPYLNSAKESVISTLSSDWLGTLNSVYQQSRAYIQNALCCNMVLCQLEKSEMKNTVKGSIAARLIGHTVHWICSESSPGMCNYSSQCQSPLARSLTKTLVEFLRKL